MTKQYRRHISARTVTPSISYSFTDSLSTKALGIIDHELKRIAECLGLRDYRTLKQLVFVVPVGRFSARACEVPFQGSMRQYQAVAAININININRRI